MKREPARKTTQQNPKQEKTENKGEEGRVGISKHVASIDDRLHAR